MIRRPRSRAIRDTGAKLGPPSASFAAFIAQLSRARLSFAIVATCVIANPARIAGASRALRYGPSGADVLQVRLPGSANFVGRAWFYRWWWMHGGSRILHARILLKYAEAETREKCLL